MANAYHARDAVHTRQVWLDQDAGLWRWRVLLYFEDTGPVEGTAATADEAKRLADDSARAQLEAGLAAMGLD